ncbi:F-box protein At1g47056-like [Telopea speciosissima]|uniref:F-box protein At1g47056-like n=1 Tax=Telopea speciosissima TaxID=54955 RepID=UPI001CC5C135|nr:F-box protein At1g47056-like [Telopea speciosissima]
MKQIQERPEYEGPFEAIGKHPQTPALSEAEGEDEEEMLAGVSSPSDIKIDSVSDFVSHLPDECLAYILKYLGFLDRESCSLVCRAWLRVEGQSRHRLSLEAKSNLLPVIPSLFTRFDAVTTLALKSGPPCKSVLIGDDALLLISLHCPNLTCLNLHACDQLTDVGITTFALNSKGTLKEFHCDFCNFSAKGMNAILNHCSSLEELSVDFLPGLVFSSAAMTIGPGVAACSLKTIRIKRLYNGQCFGPLIIGSKNLRTLKIFGCSGNWDKLFKTIVEQVTGLVEIHLETILISEAALVSISNCLDLEILHLVGIPNCTNAVLVSIVDHCKHLRELHILGVRNSNKISDEGITAIAKRCPYLEELILFGANNTTSLSLSVLAANCQNLKRLVLCWIDAVDDAVISCIAAQCIALKNLCIMCCPVTDHGLKALSLGCPNLVKVTIYGCLEITCDGRDRLKADRGSLDFNLLTIHDPFPSPFTAYVSKSYFN